MPSYLRRILVLVVPSVGSNMIGQADVHQLVIGWMEINDINAVAVTVVCIQDGCIAVGLISEKRVIGYVHIIVQSSDKNVMM